MSAELVNRIAQSGLITLDLQKFAPTLDYVAFDLKDYLFRELILREKDFREALAALDTTPYSGRQVLVYCSNDAIIPMWAYMLVATRLTGIAQQVTALPPDEFIAMRWMHQIDQLDIEAYANQRVILKGCSDIVIPPAAYTHLTGRLLPIVRSLMFGEPCSTVPVYKQKGNAAE